MRRKLYEPFNSRSTSEFTDSVLCVTLLLLCFAFAISFLWFQ